MVKIRNFGDERQACFCVHCGGSTETKDHAPSKVFLDHPYPLSRPTVPSCAACNNGFSADEEYVAAFVECAVKGSTDPSQLSRPKVAGALRRNERLRRQIELSKRTVKHEDASCEILWEPEKERIRRVALKLARCHAAYELNEPQLQEPEAISVLPAPAFDREQWRIFEVPQVGNVLPEIGSRAMQRMLQEKGKYAPNWVEVQEGRYRYLALASTAVVIRGVMSEYLCFEVFWNY